jgi:hypothetical protein
MFKPFTSTVAMLAGLLLSCEARQLVWDYPYPAGTADHFNVYECNEIGAPWQLVGQTTATNWVYEINAPRKFFTVSAVSGNLEAFAVVKLPQVMQPNYPAAAAAAASTRGTPVLPDSFTKLLPPKLK